MSYRKKLNPTLIDGEDRKRLNQKDSLLYHLNDNVTDLKKLLYVILFTYCVR